MKKFSMIEPMSKKIRSQLFMLGIFDFLSNLFLLIPSFMLSYLIDTLIPQSKIMNIVLFIITGVIILILLYVLKYYFVSFFGDRLVTYIGNHLRKIQIEKLSRLSIPKIESIEESLLFNTVFNEPNIVASGYINYKVELIIDGLLCAIYLVIIGKISIGILILIMLTLPLYYYYISTNNTRFNKAITKERKAYDYSVNSFKTYQESFSQAYILNKKDYFKNRVFQMLTKWENSRIKYNKYYTFFDTIPQFLQASIPFVIYGIGGILVVLGKMAIGEVIFTQMIVNMLFSSISSIAQTNISIQNAYPLYERIVTILKIPEEENILYVNEEYIELSNKKVNVNKEILFNIPQLKLNKNGVYLLNGKNGSGKTILFNKLAGLGYFDDDQQLYYNGNISYAIQKKLFFDNTVAENILLGDVADTTFKQIKEGLNLNIDDQKIIITNPLNLSLGQQQKILLARFFMHSQEKKIWLLDEPTTNLDKDTIEKLIKYLKEKSNKHIIFVITHDKEFETTADKIYRIENKMLTAE